MIRAATMLDTEVPIQYLLTLPTRMSEEFEGLEGRTRPEWFACCDPEPLGSGAGTAHLLVSAWQATGARTSLHEWLGASRKLVLHAGGQSRRLPAYAPVGKLLMPIPVFRWARGQRLDQSLLDLQLPEYRRVLEHAGGKTRVMVTSGDVLLRFARDLPPFPQADIVGLGMWIAPEKAKDFGVFCSPRSHPNEPAFFLQKPSAAKLRELGEDYICLVDTGMWLLSEKAVRVLLERCGWEENSQQFTNGKPRPYELYSQFGLALGTAPTAQDRLINALTCVVVPLPEAQFFHFGATRQMIASVSELQNLVLDGDKVERVARPQSDKVTQNSRFEPLFNNEHNHSLWIENSFVPSSWRLSAEHVITGVPENDWDLSLPAGGCLDFVPVREEEFCVRAYGFADTFSGKIGDLSTRWQGQPAWQWFTERELKPEDCEIDPDTDIQSCQLFPVLSRSKLEPSFIQWLFHSTAESNRLHAKVWQASARLSAAEIPRQANLRRLYQQRAELRQGCVKRMWTNFHSSVFFRLDLESTAKTLVAGDDSALPEVRFGVGESSLSLVHDQMFRAAVLRRKGRAEWHEFERNAFAQLRQLIVQETHLTGVLPQRNVLEDQVVWARSPVRFDLAGGWTDTPPYCIEHGGKVLNLAADLNSQPPIQVFAKLSARPELVMRSIDLGVEEHVRTYEELDTFAQPEKAFALAKAAFALAGFMPRFHATGRFSSLEEQLRDFGGGIELSLLSAVPKGSGLGTSSILAAALLAALGDLCGLGWDRNVLFSRTLALEQMVTTGGGWQDQAGAIFRGIKIVETVPGMAQKPVVRWLPQHLFGPQHANRSILLYYTGLTRLAKNILAEIVRGIFLNSPAQLDRITEIGANAEFAGAAIQKCDYDMLAAAIRRSWLLNQLLDSGTNPPEVQQILERVHEFLAAVKLLGAGGGGYLLMFAKDEQAAAQIRKTLTERPPNARARFVEFGVSETGLQVTRS